MHVATELDDRAPTPLPRLPSGKEKLHSAVVAAESEGRIHDAIRLLEQMIRAKPPDSQAFAHLASILVTQREFRRAEELIRQAIDLAPGNRAYETSLAKILQAWELDKSRPKTLKERGTSALRGLLRRE
jgi:cytochrome c-type biogenesis protein CcmH/NrfG